MISIGNRKVIFSETLLCPVEDSINIKVDIPNEEELWLIKINFTEEVEKDTKSHMNVLVENDLWILTFVNWTSSLGAIFTSPIEIARSIDDKPITILAEVAKLTGLYRINLQIMIDEAINNV